MAATFVKYKGTCSGLWKADLMSFMGDDDTSSDVNVPSKIPTGPQLSAKVFYNYQILNAKLIHFAHLKACVHQFLG